MRGPFARPDPPKSPPRPRDAVLNMLPRDAFLPPLVELSAEVTRVVGTVPALAELVLAADAGLPAELHKVASLQADSEEQRPTDAIVGAAVLAEGGTEVLLRLELLSVWEAEHAAVAAVLEYAGIDHSVEATVLPAERRSGCG
mmetsp:Transcript_4920/g.14928  ORF Transcript_4920/g.14928 Transcript_4920/m.14928 type:complete len:143 (-) Transcript_4920:753-1181(-)